MSRRRASAVYLVYVYSLFGLRSPVEKVESTTRKEGEALKAGGCRAPVYSRVSPDPPGTNPLNLHQIEPGFLL